MRPSGRKTGRSLASPGSQETTTAAVEIHSKSRSTGRRPGQERHPGNADIISDRSQRRDREGPQMPSRWVGANAQRTVGTVPASCCRQEFGDSCIAERAIQTLAASTAPSRNGIRQPQARRGGASADTVSGKAHRKQAADWLAAAAQEWNSGARPGPPEIGDDSAIFPADGKTHLRSADQQRPSRRPGPPQPASAGERRRASPRSSGQPKAASSSTIGVADMAEHHHSERPHQIGDGETRQGRQQRSGAPPKNTRERFGHENA